MPAARQDINNALIALASNNSGTTAPVGMPIGAMWVDTATNILKILNQNSTWTSVGGNIATPNLGLAPLASPPLTGTPTAPTAATATSNNQIATTAFVQNNINIGSANGGYFIRLKNGWAIQCGSFVVNYTSGNVVAITYPVAYTTWITTVAQNGDQTSGANHTIVVEQWTAPNAANNLSSFVTRPPAGVTATIRVNWFSFGIVAPI